MLGLSGATKKETGNDVLSHEIPTHSPSPCVLAICDMWLLSFSEKQFRGPAGRSVWYLGQRIRGRPLHVTQLPKQIPPRTRMHLHHWRYRPFSIASYWQICHVTVGWLVGGGCLNGLIAQSIIQLVINGVQHNDDDVNKMMCYCYQWHHQSFKITRFLILLLFFNHFIFLTILSIYIGLLLLWWIFLQSNGLHIFFWHVKNTKIIQSQHFYYYFAFIPVELYLRYMVG